MPFHGGGGLQMLLFLEIESILALGSFGVQYSLISYRIAFDSARTGE